MCWALSLLYHKHRKSVVLKNSQERILNIRYCTMKPNGHRLSARSLNQIVKRWLFGTVRRICMNLSIHTKKKCDKKIHRNIQIALSLYGFAFLSCYFFLPLLFRSILACAVAMYYLSSSPSPNPHTNLIIFLLSYYLSIRIKSYQRNDGTQNPYGSKCLTQFDSTRTMFRLLPFSWMHAHTHTHSSPLLL